LRAAGPGSETPRTYRRAYRPPSGSNELWDDLGPLSGGHILAPSSFVLWYLPGRQSPLSGHRGVWWNQFQDLPVSVIALRVHCKGVHGTPGSPVPP